MGTEKEPFPTKTEGLSWARAKQGPYDLISVTNFGNCSRTVVALGPPFCLVTQGLLADLGLTKSAK